MNRLIIYMCCGLFLFSSCSKDKMDFETDESIKDIGSEMNRQYQKEIKQRASLISIKYELQTDVATNIIQEYKKRTELEVMKFLESPDVYKMEERAVVIGDLSKKFGVAPKIIASMIIDYKILDAHDL